MTKYITGRRWRVLALSFALGLFAATNAASIAQAAQRYPLFPQTEQDRWTDPQTGISRPDNPALNGG